MWRLAFICSVVLLLELFIAPNIIQHQPFNASSGSGMAGEAAQVVIAAIQQKGIVNVDSGKPQAFWLIIYHNPSNMHVVS